MDILDDVVKSLELGSSSAIRKHVRTALEEGISYKIILKTMLSTMEDIGEKFRKNIIFVPEVLIVGRAFNVALEEIHPYIINNDDFIGTVVIGTVEGDHHDVGKNIVKLFLESSDIKVIDLGINVSAQDFLKAINEHKPDIVAMSALLTTTMIEMEKVITKIEEGKLRDKLKIIIGGAPITENFAINVGADYYANDAYGASTLIKSYLLSK